MKKAIGIISIVLFCLVAFQSCAAGIGNALSSNGEISGSAGMMLAFAMLIGGILTLVSKESKGLIITAIVFYMLGGLIGIANFGSFADLQIWSAISLLFGGLLIFNMIKNKKAIEKDNSENLN